jgi:hypothetical protein
MSVLGLGLGLVVFQGGKQRLVWCEFGIARRAAFPYSIHALFVYSMEVALDFVSSFATETAAE